MGAAEVFENQVIGESWAPKELVPPMVARTEESSGAAVVEMD